MSDEPAASFLPSAMRLRPLEAYVLDWRRVLRSLGLGLRLNV